MTPDELDLDSLRLLIGDGPEPPEEFDEASRGDVWRSLIAHVERLEGLVSRIATAAVRYDARVYALSDDFLAIEPYLSDEDRATLGERPGDAAHRTAAERDEARAEVARLRAQVAAVEALRPTHRHRGLSWGDGDIEYVAFADIRAAIAEAGGASPSLYLCTCGHTMSAHMDGSFPTRCDGALDCDCRQYEAGGAS